MNNLDPISKRARTKIVIRRSKPEPESSATDKAIESPIVRKKKYSDKGKSSSSRRRTAEKTDLPSNELDGADQSNPVQDGSVDVSINGNQEAENVTTPAKRLSKKKKSKVNGESSEIKPEESHELSPGIVPVLALEAATPTAKKRKNKDQSHNNKKKRKTKSGSESSRKRPPKAGSSGASKSKGKSKVAGGDGEDMIDVLKDEVCFFLLLVCFFFSFKFA